MLDSVRGRLALWHTAILAVMLVAFATATDLWLERAAGRACGNRRALTLPPSSERRE